MNGYWKLPTMWVDFVTHSVKAENKEMYEGLFTKPLDESHIRIASQEYFMYFQMEIKKMLESEVKND